MTSVVCEYLGGLDPRVVGRLYARSGLDFKSVPVYHSMFIVLDNQAVPFLDELFNARSCNGFCY